MILTSWKVNDKNYKKIKEVYIFEQYDSNITFCPEGKFLMLSALDSWSIFKSDDLSLKAKVKPSDMDSNFETTYSSWMLLKDARYVAQFSYERGNLVSADGTLEATPKLSNGDSIDQPKAYSVTHIVGT